MIAPSEKQTNWLLNSWKFSHSFFFHSPSFRFFFELSLPDFLKIDHFFTSLRHTNIYRNENFNFNFV